MLKGKLSLRTKSLRIFLYSLGTALALWGVLRQVLVTTEQEVQQQESSLSWQIQKIVEHPAGPDPKKKQRRVTIQILQKKLQAAKQELRQIHQEEEDINHLHTIFEEVEATLQRWPDLVSYALDKVNTTNDECVRYEQELGDLKRQKLKGKDITEGKKEVAAKITAYGVEMHRMKGSLGSMTEELSTKLDNVIILRDRLLAKNDPQFSPFLDRVDKVIDEGRILQEDLEHLYDSVGELLEWLTRLYYKANE